MGISNVGSHYTDMKGKPCPLIPKWAYEEDAICETGYCPDCRWLAFQKYRAKELAKEIDNLGEK